jgi:serine/threonine-protein kinase HipA
VRNRHAVERRENRKPPASRLHRERKPAAVSEIRAVEVRVWDKRVGAVAALHGKPGHYEFQYDPDFVKSGVELSPLKMPLAINRRYSFPALAVETYHGLPGLLADSMPDKFGNALIDEYLSRSGLRVDEITTLQRLLYIGRRAMGALEYEPALKDVGSRNVAAPLEMAHLVEDARRALRGRSSRIAQEIIDVGSSAGGARAKAVIGWNPRSGEIVSGQFDLPPDFEHWLLKFDVGENRALGHTAGFGRIEYAHYLMARDAGVTMSACRLLEENGRAHFMTRRFDRAGNAKLHFHSLCGLQHLDYNSPYVHSYEQYLRAALELKLGADAVKQAWLRCAFNVAAVNCDDHTKNFAFIREQGGGWSLSPAFDVCFAHNPRPNRWTRQHQMLVNGKAWNITRDDLLELATKFSVNQPKRLLERLLDAVARWPEFAREAGVPAPAIKHIAALQPDLS